MLRLVPRNLTGFSSLLVYFPSLIFTYSYLQRKTGSAVSVLLLCLASALSISYVRWRDKAAAAALEPKCSRASAVSADFFFPLYLP